jgi:predicted N-acetyltransferase YhbS
MGQVGVEHRVIRVGRRSLEIFGVIDLAVSSSCRSCGHGKALLVEVEAIASRNGVDGIMLFADDHRLYKRCNYRLIERETTWLGIHDFESNGLITELLEECMLVKPVSIESWPKGDIDMLGYLF